MEQKLKLYKKLSFYMLHKTKIDEQQKHSPEHIVIHSNNAV